MESFIYYNKIQPNDKSRRTIRSKKIQVKSSNLLIDGRVRVTYVSY